MKKNWYCQSSFQAFCFISALPQPQNILLISIRVCLVSTYCNPQTKILGKILTTSTISTAQNPQTPPLASPWIHSPALQSRCCWTPSSFHLERYHSGSGCIALLEKYWSPAMYDYPTLCTHTQTNTLW